MTWIAFLLEALPASARRRPENIGLLRIDFPLQISLPHSISGSRFVRQAIVDSLCFLYRDFDYLYDTFHLHEAVTFNTQLGGLLNQQCLVRGEKKSKAQTALLCLQAQNVKLLLNIPPTTLLISNRTIFLEEQNYVPTFLSNPFLYFLFCESILALLVDTPPLFRKHITTQLLPIILSHAYGRVFFHLFFVLKPRSIRTYKYRALNFLKFLKLKCPNICFTSFASATQYWATTICFVVLQGHVIRDLLESYFIFRQVSACLVTINFEITFLANIRNVLTERLGCQLPVFRKLTLHDPLVKFLGTTCQRAADPLPLPLYWKFLLFSFSQASPKTYVGTLILHFLFLTTFRISETLNLLMVNVFLKQVPICSFAGTSFVSTLSVTFNSYKTLALGAPAKTFSLPIFKGQAQNLAVVFQGLLEARDPTSFMLLDFLAWPQPTYATINRFFHKQLRAFSDSLSPADQSIVSSLRLTLHTLRKTGARYYQSKSLTIPEIKMFTGHSVRSSILQELYLQPSPVDLLSSTSAKMGAFCIDVPQNYPPCAEENLPQCSVSVPPYDYRKQVSHNILPHNILPMDHVQ